MPRKKYELEEEMTTVGENDDMPEFEEEYGYDDEDLAEDSLIDDEFQDDEDLF